MELVVALVVVGLIITGVMVLMEQSQKAYIHGAEAADLQQGLRVAMDRMVRVIQAAGVNPQNEQWGGLAPNDPAFVAFRGAGTSCLRVYADLNGDGDVADTDENIAFSWSGTNGAALTQEAGVSGSGPDAGQWWVSGGTGAEELTTGLVANPGGTAMFRYFTSPADAAGGDVELVPSSGSDCTGLSDVNRARVGRIVITLTARATIANETFTKTLVSEVRPRNVP
jgi:type II secretory pathway component PulJ